MNYSKCTFAVFAIALMSMPTMVEAQQISTRRGAVAGAIIGGIIGDQNNEALAGATIGGLVGAVTGNALDRNKYATGYNGYNRPVPNVRVQYRRPPAPVYRGGKGSTYNRGYVPARGYVPPRGGGYGGRGCR